MATPDDRIISREDVLAAVATRDLPGLVEGLVRERSWASIGATFGYAAALRAAASIDDLRAAAEALRRSLQAQPPRARRAGAGPRDEVREALLAAGEALLVRSAHPPASDAEREALRLAAAMLGEAGDHRRAASAYEELGDDASAADAYGALGDLDRMEASLGREDARRRARHEALDAVRSFDTLLAAGERAAALAAAARIPADLPASAAVRQRAREIEGRLVRARAVTLRAAGAAVRFAALPAALGRDPAAELPVRDLGVSRRHAIIARRGDDIVLEDAGSRAGVRVAGALLGAPLPLRGAGEVGLGRDCRIAFQALAPGRVQLRGATGLDRQLVALVGDDPLPLDELLPAGGGAWIELQDGVARLGRGADVVVRVGGQYVGPRCDLLHGDVIEIGGGADAAAPPLRIEVE
jgi:hypothetical protein